MLKIRIDGCKQLSEALEALPKAVTKKILRQAMRPAIKPVMAEAKENAPVKTGALKKNIKLKAAPRSTKFIGIDVIVGDKWNTGKTFYGFHVESGTKFGKNNTKDESKYGSQRIRPHNFIKDAYEHQHVRAKYKAIEKMQDLLYEEMKSYKLV